MTDENTTTPAAAAAAPEPESKPIEEQTVILVSYPKIVFLYPTLIAALICGMYMWISGAQDLPEVDPAAVVQADEAADADAPAKELTEQQQAAEKATARSHTAHVMARFFLLVFTINLVVISFDFPRTTSLTLFFFIIAVGVVLWMVFRLNPDMIPSVDHFINWVTPYANAPFYFMVSLVLVGLFTGVAAAARFDYWEVRPNELLHHHGVLSDLERFSAPNLRINKEINDVFEYALLRSGRLILHPSNERKAIVLDNVFFINRKETQITRMLGALQVQVREQQS